MDVVSVTTALQAPAPGVTPRGMVGPDSGSGEARTPQPAHAAPDMPSLAPNVAWFDLDGDGQIEPSPVRNGGDAYLASPGAGGSARPAPPPRRVFLSATAPQADRQVPSLANPRMRRAAEAYRRDGGSGSHPQVSAAPTIAERVLAQVEAAAARPAVSTVPAAVRPVVQAKRGSGSNPAPRTASGSAPSHPSRTVA